MADSRAAFYFGLNMSGAVSAGAYTAGVMDFFIDALDGLYAEREHQTEQFGDDFSRWTIPAHELRLAVMSGASAGGITAALAAAALCEDFSPVRISMPSGLVNRLYKTWVTDIDMQGLLDTRDLQSETDPIVSLLDSTIIDRVAETAVRVTKPRQAGRRIWVNDGLKVVLTLTNLGGIPYAIEEGSGSAETQTLYHADQRDFELRWEGNSASSSAVLLRPELSDNWDSLAACAKATSAFPFALAPRVLKSPAGIYNNRLWRVANDNPQPGLPECGCSSYQKLQPSWNAGDKDLYQSLNVDGGVTNNSPFECAHRELCQQAPPHAPGHNPRSGTEADRAVVSIAPFLSAPDFKFDTLPSRDLLSQFGQLMNTLVNQSRIQGENIILTRNPNVFSRFAISPSLSDSVLDALASASLGAFGGFLAEGFRDHDYQLGRRNCQRFLQQHFLLPMDNVVFRQYATGQEVIKRWSTKMDNQQKGMPIIPLVDDLDVEVPRPARTAIARDDLEATIDLALARLKLILSRLLHGHGPGWITEPGFAAIWLLLKGKVRQTLLAQAGKALARQGLID